MARADLRDANLREANFRRADLSEALFTGADLRGAVLAGAELHQADFSSPTFLGDPVGSDLRGADLRGAELDEANLMKVDLRMANLSGANLVKVNLSGADLREADLSRADLRGANLGLANLGLANLANARLEGAHLIETNLENANLNGCYVYGISAWNLCLKGAAQRDLVITPQSTDKEFAINPNSSLAHSLSTERESIITVDHLEVAQFIYLLLRNENIRQILDTIGKRVVLILGRFTVQRKAVLESIRDALRSKGYLPLLFDTQRPESRDFIETVSTLAHLSRFVIADFTDARIVLEEVPHIVRSIAVPVAPLLLKGSGEEPVTIKNLRINHYSVLDTYWYENSADLIASIDEKIIRPAEIKANELLKRRFRFLESPGTQY